MSSKRIKISIDTVLLAIASVTFCVAVYKLIADSSVDHTAREGYVPLGHVRDVNNDVRRRLPRAFTWNSLPTGDAIYDGDTVFTGDESGVTVQLDTDGSTGSINLGPRTLVVLRRESRGGSTIELRYGEAEGKGSNIAVAVKEGPVTKKVLEGTGTFNAKKKKGDAARVKALTEGFALSATKQQIKANETVKVEKETGVSITSGEIIPTTPGTGASVWFKSGDKVALEWRTAGVTPAKDFVVELSGDPEFKALSKTAKTEKPKLSIDPSELPPGPLHWRVRSATDKSIVSNPSNVALYPDSPVQLTSPVPSERITFDPEKGEAGKPISLVWKDPAGSREYTIELARDANFTDKVKTLVSATPSTVTETLSEGVYHWRVIGKHPSRANAPWSAPSSFEVRSSLIVPAVPQIPAQATTYQLPLSIVNRVPAKLPPSAPGIVPPADMPPIKWAPVPNATAYEIEVAADERFTNSLTMTTTAPSWTPAKVKPGPLFMRVKAKGRAGVASVTSAPSRLDIELPAPELAQVKNVGKKFETQAAFDKARQELKFTWTPRPWAAGYELELARDADFKVKKGLLVKDPQKAITITDPGDYHFRVRAVAADGAPLSTFSSPKRVTYRKVLDVPKAAPIMTTIDTPDAKVAGQIIRSVNPPTPIEPRRRTNVISLDDTPTYVTFRWKPVRGANQYVLQIASDKTFANVISEVKLRDTDYVFEDRLPAGAVYWRVRAEKTIGRTPASENDTSEWSPVFDLKILRSK